MFYSGHIHLGNWKYADFYDKQPMNLRKVEIYFYKFNPKTLGGKKRKKCHDRISILSVGESGSLTT